MEKQFRNLCRTVARENGMKFIAKGAFSRVYGNKNTVVKIIDLEEGQLDTLAFLRYAKRNFKDNPYLPRVYSIHEGEHFAIVVMEKLSNARWKRREEVMEEIAGSGSGDMIFRRELKAACHFTKDPNLKRVLKYLDGRILRTGANLDLHPYNYLWRGKQIVITDPFSS